MVKPSGAQPSFSITTFDLIILKVTNQNHMAITYSTTGESGWVAERSQ